MKKLVVAFPVIVLFLLSSCRKDDESNAPANNAPEGGLTAKINGEDFTFSDSNFGGSRSGSFLYLSGGLTKDSVVHNLYLTFYQVYEPKTYTGSIMIGRLETHDLRTNISHIWTTQSGSSTSEQSTVTFTKLDTTNNLTSGTFKFTAGGDYGQDPIVVDGAFKNVVIE